MRHSWLSREVAAGLKEVALSQALQKKKEKKEQKRSGELWPVRNHPSLWLSRDGCLAAAQ